VATSKIKVRQITKFKVYDPPITVNVDGALVEARIGVVIKDVTKDYKGNTVILKRQELPLPGETKAELKSKLTAHRTTAAARHKTVTDIHAEELAEVDVQLTDADTLPE